jgi:CRP-like cAMP-binding protein
MDHPLIKKLEKIAPLPPDETRAILDLASTTRELPADQDVVREGDRSAECHLILEGFLCRYKVLPGGRRQIIGFQLPGDFCDLSAFVLGRMDHSVGTLTPALVAVVPYRKLDQITARYPHLTRALWQETLVDASISREWVANVGARTAYQRVAHVLCEIGLRLEAVGRTRNGGFEWPLTQSEIADATGLSAVHVNRTIQRLRAEELIALSGRRLVVPDWERLQQAGEFQPDYLFLHPAPEQSAGRSLT